MLLPAGYLSTEGNQVVDASGTPVRIASIGWDGTDSLNFAPYGLWQSSLESNIEAIKAAGFNTIRIPWSDLLLNASPVFTSGDATYNPNLDPELVGKTSLQLLDILVADAGAAGLKVIFVHQDDDGGPGGWGGQQANGLWFDSGPGSDGTDGSGTAGTVTAAQFQSDSVELAQNFAGNSTVIGFDVDNEPTSQGNINWGQGGPTDIQAMYTQVGNAIQAVDPGALIICEGVENWSGPEPGMPAGFAEGDLSGVATDPVTLNVANKVVYSVHEYPPDLSGNGSYTSSQQIAEMNAGWGYLETDDIAPVWVGEIGSNLESTQDQTWIQGVLDYMNGKDAAEGGPSFSGDEQPVSGDWWQWGTASGQDPQGIETAWGSDTYWSAQIQAADQLAFNSTAPAAPSITSSGGLVSASVETVTGTADADSTVQVYDGSSSTPLATTVPDSTGNWSVGVTFAIDGQNRLTATATNSLGSVSPVSAAIIFTVEPAVSSPTVTVAENSVPVPIGIQAPSDPLYATSTLTITVTSLPSNGSVTLADGSTALTVGATLSVAQLTGLLFNPIAGRFSSSSAFTYIVADAAGQSSTGTATLAIGPAVGNPAVSSPTLTVAENAAAAAIGILAPSDPNYAASTLTVTVASLPSNGTVTLADGSTPVTSGETLSVAELTGLLFSPATGLSSSSGVFTYSVADPAGNTSTGSAAISIGPAVTSPSTVASTILLDISEDAYDGDAEFTVSVDGQQVGSTYTATSSHGAGQTEPFNISADLTPGVHAIGVTFINDLYQGTPQTDRNLYVDAVTLNGLAIANSQATLLSNGTSTVYGTVNASAPVAPTTVPVTIVLNVAEDYYEGDAQFTVSIDGTQLAGPYTATGLNSSGQSNAVTLSTDLTAGAHTIGVTFFNDAYGGSPSLDRNLYVDSVSVNGGTIPNSQATLDKNGAATFDTTVTASSSGSSGSSGSGGSTGSDGSGGSGGSGSSTGLVLNVSEDAYQGDAQFIVTVNGAQVGSTYTATAANTAGQTEAIAIPATLGSGANTVAITFLNDAYGGSSATDRNLYLDSATMNGTTVAGRETLLSDGTADFNFNGTSPATAVTNSLVLNVSEDAYQGDAQMVVAVDGQTQGYYTVTASHAAGQTQAVTINDIPESFSAHDIAVSFVNDAYGNSPSLDRNLYVNSMTFDGQAVAGGSAALMTNSTDIFTASAPASWAA